MSTTETFRNFSSIQYSTGDNAPHHADSSGAAISPGISRHPSGSVPSQQSGVVRFAGSGQIIIDQVASSGQFIVDPFDVISPRNRGDVLSIDDLFGQLPEMSVGTLSSALRLLDEAVSHSQIAVDVFDSDPITADDEMQRVQALLPELFCCRTIGDGFGALVNSIQYAPSNQKGLPLSGTQIAKLRGAFKKLRETPFISFEEAVDLAMAFEDSGLVIDPPALSDLADAPAD